MKALLRRLAYLFRRDRHAEELAEELAHHRAMLEAEERAAGKAPEEAARAARRRMGNETLEAEDARGVWAFRLLDELARDLGFGARMALRNGRATLLAILALGTGIGLVAAVFIAHEALIEMPVAARDAGEIVNIALLRETPQVGFSYPDYLDYREEAESFADLIAGGFARVTLSHAGPVVSQEEAIAQSGFGKLGILRPGIMNQELARAHVVSENYFEALGVRPVLGRTFAGMSAQELREQPAALISENYWDWRFDRDPEILGRTVHLNKTAVRIIGVTPRDFVGTDFLVPPFWIPISLDGVIHADPGRLEDRESTRYNIRGRLAPGVTMERAEAEVDAIADRLCALHERESEQAMPAEAMVWRGSPHTLPVEMQGAGLDVALLAPLLAVLMVLGVACANVASLQLARVRARQDELRARLGLGASRGRVVRQLATESALVGAAAGCAALLCTWGIGKQIAVRIADAIPLENGTPVFDPTPGPGVVVIVFGVALAAGVAAGLAPALESTRAALAATVRSSASSGRTRRLQNALVGAQVCLSLALLIGAGALVHSAVRSLTAPTGYDTEDVVMLDVRFPEALGYGEARVAAVTEQLRERLAAHPTVARVASARGPDAPRFRTAGLAARSGVQAIVAYTYVEPGYFATLGIPLLLGRDLDAAGSAVVVSESAAEKWWPGENPVGRLLRLGDVEERRLRPEEMTADGAAYVVAGVAADKRSLSLDAAGAAEVYLPLPREQRAERTLLLRARSGSEPLLAALEPLIRSVDPDLEATAVTLEDALRQTPAFVASSMTAVVATVVGVCGLGLALMGIYGTVGYIVVLRTREIGVRMALGARKRDVVGQVLRETFRPVLEGLAAGAVLAGAGVFLVQRMVAGVGGFDAAAVFGVSALFLAAALAAAVPPARRAARIDPMRALREE